MALRLDFANKYELWTNVVRANTHRLLVPTEQAPRVGGKVNLELKLPELRLPIVVKGKVVGRRDKSDRFEAGVYLKVEDEELDKVRRYLGLAPRDSDAEKMRRYPRLKWAAQVRFVEPNLQEAGEIGTISESGIDVNGPVGELVAGQQVKMAIFPDPDKADSIDLSVEVVWATEGRMGGRFVDMSRDERTRLVDVLGSCIDCHSPETTPRILVADDDPMVLQFLTQALELHSYEVVAATSGDEALRLIRTQRPRLVLMDILMPGVDGVATCAMIKGDAELCDLPVIFMSAIEPDKLHELADEAGASDYIHKPMNLGDLMNLVGRYLATEPKEAKAKKAV